jgi:hypothetical protein
VAVVAHARVATTVCLNCGRVQPELMDVAYAIFVHCAITMLDDREQLRSFLMTFGEHHEMRYRTEIERLHAVVDKVQLTQELVSYVCVCLVIH